jgi:hypothetical protein
MSLGITYVSGFTDPSGGDIYIKSIQCGVYGINLGGGSNPGISPIPTSITNMELLGLANGGSTDGLDALIVYPGFGFIVYDTVGYQGVVSADNINLTTTPILYYFGGSWSETGGLPIYISGGTTPFGANSTSSIKIYFQSITPTMQLTVSGLS